MRCFDFDDHHETNDALPRMRMLKEINPAFKVTLFSVPGLGSEEFWRSHPDWVEIAWHGWLHPDPRECEHWTYERMDEWFAEPVVACRTTDGWKSPGWQISDDTYRWLLDHGFWVADQHLENGRRPAALRTYFYEDGGWHGHVQDVCGNGIAETWEALCEAVRDETEFRFASEAIGKRADAVDPFAEGDAARMQGVGAGANLPRLGAPRRGRYEP